METITAANYADRVSAFRASDSARTMEECRAILHYLAELDTLSSVQEDDQKFVLAWKRSYGQVALAEARIKKDETEILSIVIKKASPTVAAVTVADVFLTAVRDAISKGYKGISLSATLEDDGTVRSLVTNLISTAAPVKAAGTKVPGTRRAKEHSFADLKLASDLAKKEPYLGYTWHSPENIISQAPDKATYVADSRKTFSDGGPDKWYAHLVQWERARQIIDALGVDHASIIPYRRELPKTANVVAAA